MKASKLTFFAAMALGSVLTLGTALAADTNAPSSTPSAGAPPAGGPRGMRGPNLEQITKDLNLTEDQKPKVKEVLDAMQADRRKLMQDQSVSQEDRRSKMQAIREDVNKKMKAILTDEQYSKWEKSPMNRMGGPRGQRPGGGGAGTNGGGTPPQN